ncbi:MAG: DUF4019 domain-containing protein [Candidatus Binataceae bacterium]
MTRAIRYGVIAACLVVALAAGVRADEKADEAAAQTVALGWLHEIDAGQYAQAWRQAAAPVKAAATADQFASAMDAVRKPLGAVTSRKFESATYATSLPSAPPGKYVVVVYATDFAGRRAAKEIVTPMLEKDGQWRVSGYYIR